MSRYQKFVSELKKVVAPDDIIGAMICQMNKKKLPTDPKDINGAVMKLKEDYPNLVKNFVFFKGNNYPFSDLLERVLFRLESSLLLSTLNPAYEKYSQINCSQQTIEMFKDPIQYWTLGPRRR